MSAVKLNRLKEIAQVQLPVVHFGFDRLGGLIRTERKGLARAFELSVVTNVYVEFADLNTGTHLKSYRGFVDTRIEGDALFSRFVRGVGQQVEGRACKNTQEKNLDANQYR